MIAYVGRTAFAKGAWIGVELDTPTGKHFSAIRLCLPAFVIKFLTFSFSPGKNDGLVNGVRYFTCKPRFGVFVRPDKLALDKRGRVLREMSAIHRSVGEGQKTFFIL